MITPDTTLADAVVQHSACAPVFQRHGLDYCCGGKATIARAAERGGLDVVVLLEELRRATQLEEDDGSGAMLQRLPAADLVALLVSRHHAYLREHLPFLTGLSAKVARVHGATNPKLMEVHSLVVRLSGLLLPHLDTEEAQVFPALLAAELDARSVRALLAAMKDEHELVSLVLKGLYRATDGHTAPAWACTSYRAMVGGLVALEADILRHVHIENHILAPLFGAC